MKNLNYLLIFLFLMNCSFNDSSTFWTEDSINKNAYKDKLNEIMNKSDDLFNMNYDEYKIFLNEYVKKSNYPDLSK